MKFGIPILIFVLALGALTLANGSSGRNAGAPAAFDSGPIPRDTEGLIESLQDQLEANPSDGEVYAQLGDAFVQRTRETGDPSYYVRAEKAFGEALRRDPADLTAVVGAGTLALSRHDFRKGLRLGLQAKRLAPQVVRPSAVIVDGQIELGRYDAAHRSLQAMVNAKPNLASYSRISYFRELMGDLPGAIEAMRLAVSAGAGTSESLASVLTLLGDLHLAGGDIASARRAYREALAASSAFLPAEAGLARLAIASGDLARAESDLQAVTERLPLTNLLILLAEVQLTRGEPEEGRQTLDVVRLQRRLLVGAGTRPDVDAVLFQADYGSASRAVSLGRQVLRAAPSVRSEDALGWALTGSGRPGQGLKLARRAVRFDSLDPAFHYHLGIAAAKSGRPALARVELQRALGLNPAFSPLQARHARQALKALA